MGMALFYLKARFSSAAKARDVADLALPRFVDIEKLERDWDRISNDYERYVKDRYDWLLHKHPLAAEFFPRNAPEDMDVRMNFFIRLLPDVKPGRVDFDLVVKDDVLYLKSWASHLTDWDPIVRWLEKHGALKAKWASSEDLGMEPGPKDWKPGGPVTPFDKIRV